MGSGRGLKILLLLVIVCGVFLRVTNLEQKGYFEVFTALRVSGYDEHDDANPALYTGQPVSIPEVLKFQTFNDENDLSDTLRGLARKEPQVTPLYFVLAALAARAVNDTPYATRLVSALASVAGLGALFWLCRALFAGSNAGWWAAALAAASPLWLRYAHEARMYMLWLALLMVACALCIRATRTNNSIVWILYALVFSLSLYTHLYGVVFLGALGLYVLAVCQWRLERRVWLFGLASVAALALFLPWARILLGNLGMARATTAYMGRATPPGVYLESVGFNFARIFFGLYPEQVAWLPIVVIPLAALAVYAIYFLWRRASRTTALFLSAFILLDLLPFLFMDIVLGGYRAALAHYLLPAMLGIEICIAFLFADMLNNEKGWRARAWQTTAVVLVLGGLVSTAITWQRTTWWDILASDVEVAPLLRQAPERIVVSETNFGEVARLSHALPLDTGFVLTKTPDKFAMPETDSTVFVYSPSPAFATRLEQTGHALELIYETVEPDRAITTLYLLRAK